jgi:glycosyltransferase involved in cell wall biosynthesis
VNCLHAGLIPLVSYESGVDVEDFGLVFKECSVEEIRSAVEYVSSLKSAELATMSKRAWEYARARHTREQFAKEYDMAVERIIASVA